MVSLLKGVIFSCCLLNFSVQTALSGSAHTKLFLLTKIYFWYFFSRLAYSPHVSVENGHRKRIFLKMLSRVEIFENAGFSFTCGRTKAEVFKNDSNTLHKDAYFFENGEKSLDF